MQTAIKTALMAAMPDYEERLPLARQIASKEQVTATSTEDLTRLETEHEVEILSLEGRIEASAHTRWAIGARQALRALRLHQRWIVRELARRHGEERRSAHNKSIVEASRAKAIAQQELTQRQREADAAKAARITAANDENKRQIAVFKAVAREVLGDEMYSHIWELTRLRMEAASKTHNTI